MNQSLTKCSYTKFGVAIVLILLVFVSCTSLKQEDIPIGGLKRPEDKSLITMYNGYYAYAFWSGMLFNEVTKQLGEIYINEGYADNTRIGSLIKNATTTTSQFKIANPLLHENIQCDVKYNSQPHKLIVDMRVNGGMNRFISSFDDDMKLLSMTTIQGQYKYNKWCY